MSKLPLIRSFEENSRKWEQKDPIKKLKTLPKMVGITKETKKGLKWKAFNWILTQDHTGGVRKRFLKKPFSYGIRYLKSLFKKASYKRDGDFFLYGINSVNEFKKLAEDAIIIVGFSYCQKPFECPSGRFTDQCQPINDHRVCSQCSIAKLRLLLPQDVITLSIPTVHYIGEKVMEVKQKNPKKRVLFMITACEMTLEMFSDWGNMVDIQGIGVRLDGRICNTMEAFRLSEEGIKPGLTVVTEETEHRMIDIIQGVIK